MRTQVQLYRIECYSGKEPRLVAGVAKSITHAYITFWDRDEFSRWETKTHARNLGKVYHETPAAAWTAFQDAQRTAQAELKILLTRAANNLQVAQLALDALYRQLRNGCSARWDGDACGVCGAPAGKPCKEAK
jgi:hypothetical protein